MPMHDWTRVGAWLYHDFHLLWRVSISRALNDGRLSAERVEHSKWSPRKVLCSLRERVLIPLAERVEHFSATARAAGTSAPAAADSAGSGLTPPPAGAVR